MKEHFLPNAALMERSDEISESMKTDAGAIMAHYFKHFKSVFNYFCKQGTVAAGGGKFSSANTMSVYQVLLILNSKFFIRNIDIIQSIYAIPNHVFLKAELAHSLHFKLQYLMFVKECKLSLIGFSYNLCLEIFVTVNQEVTDKTLTPPCLLHPY